MTNPQFVYTTYIKSTPEKLWTAITNPEFAKQYWGGNANISDWKQGSKWQHVTMDKERLVRIVGEVVESVPPKRLVLTWADPSDSTDSSRVTFEITPINDMVCLSIMHGEFKAGSSMPGKISMGWPLVLSSLKSYLETGKAIDIMAAKLTDCAKAAAKGAAA